MKKLKKIIKNGIFLIFFAFFVPFFSILAINEWVLSEAVFDNEISVCGVDLSGLTLDKAKDKLEKAEKEEEGEYSLTLTFGDKKWVYEERDFSVTSGIHTVLDEMYKYKSLSGKSKTRLIKKIKEMGFDSDVAVRYSLTHIEDKLDEIAKEIDLAPVNATAVFSPVTSRFEVREDRKGREIDREKLYDDIVNMTSHGESGEIKIKTKDVKAEYKSEDIKKALKKQGEYSTSFSQSSADRKSNIKIASQQLCGVEIMPGEEFSFNEVVGRRTKENGYKEAKIIKDGVFVQGVGGGVCQVSTTLYNALLLSGIEVTEAHKHSLPVSYVPPAMDAMVSFGSADLKFINDTPLPIYISSQASGDRLTIKIYGLTKDDDTTIKLRSEIVREIIPDKDKIIKDTEGKYSDKIMFKGEYLKVKNAKNGYEARSYIDIYKDEVLSSTKEIRHAIYDAQCGIIYEGVDDLPEGMTLPKNM